MHVLEQYGYFGLFGLLVLGIVGLPLPDETLLTIVGLMIKQGHMNFASAFLAAVLGSWLGISLSYILGRVLGQGIINRFGRLLHLTEEKVLRMEEYMERYGSLMLFFGYFIPGVRHVTALTAGMSQMKYRFFAPFAYGGAVLWAVTFLMLGQVLAPKLHRLEHVLYPFRYWIILLVAVSLIAPIFWRKFRPNRRKKEV
jgi:membrane protein DedA with SNARE-associated domain